MGEVNLRGQYAGFVSRLVAYAIDLALVTVSLIILGWLARTTTELLRLPELLSPQAGLLLGGAIAALLVVCYYTVLWAVTGQTVGKMIMGLRVVSADGKSHLSFKRSLVRFFGYVVSAVPLFAGFLWILIDNDRRGWHDRIANTHVIYHWDARANVETLMNLQARWRAGQSENPE